MVADARRTAAGRRGRLVMLGSQYPLLDAFWTILMFFLFFVWIYILIVVIIDIFRSRDLSGWGKALWLLFIVIIPLIGLLVYLIVRGGKMHERAAAQMQQQQQAFDQYVRETAGSSSSADELAKLADLKDRGAISEEDFQKAKAKILAT
jgi:hypothetical protein